MEWQVGVSQYIFSMTLSERERWTKWDVVRMLSRELNLPMEHVTEVTKIPPTLKYKSSKVLLEHAIPPAFLICPLQTPVSLFCFTKFLKYNQLKVFSEAIGSNFDYHTLLFS